MELGSGQDAASGTAAVEANARFVEGGRAYVERQRPAYRHRAKAVLDTARAPHNRATNALTAGFEAVGRGTAENSRNATGPSTPTAETYKLSLDQTQAAGPTTGPHRDADLEGRSLGRVSSSSPNSTEYSGRVLRRCFDRA